MQPNSITEFQKDLRVAISRNSTAFQRQQAIDWQVSNSTNQDYKILQWLVDDSWRVEKPNCHELIMALSVSSQLGVEDVLRFYLKSKSNFKSATVEEQVQYALFLSQKRGFLKRFEALDETTRFGLLSELFALDSHNYHFPLEVCYLAERCDWGVLHRLKPWRNDHESFSELQVVADRWYTLWETYNDIYRKNDTGAS